MSGLVTVRVDWLLFGNWLMLNLAMVVWILVAQAMDPISGGAGWIGAGLLGLVLGWLLLKHLPDKDRRDERKDELHRQHVTALMNDWKSSLREILKHCDEETKELAKAFKEELQRAHYLFDDQHPPRRRRDEHDRGE